MQTLRHCHLSMDRYHRLPILCWQDRLPDCSYKTDNCTGRWWCSHLTLIDIAKLITFTSMFFKNINVNTTNVAATLRKISRTAHKACSQTYPQTSGLWMGCWKWQAVQSTKPPSPPHMIHTISSLQEGLQQKLLVWKSTAMQDVTVRDPPEK